MQSMASRCAHFAFAPVSPHRDRDQSIITSNCNLKTSSSSSSVPPAVLFSSHRDGGPSYNTLVFQLKGWYNKDDVVAQLTEVKGKCLDVHCYVSGPNPLLDLAAEFIYHIFSKELPLVLKAVLHGDSDFFSEHQELTNALVRVYFHSSSKKYNRVESWGPLKDAAQERGGDDRRRSFLTTSKGGSHNHKYWGSPKSMFQALAAFLL